ncbi:M1 family metallopeptidase [Cloacibacterium sp.]|uniref:M1 family metallopeptidase n=1 Tax=Cloacibacterium sp. TaxID=1913682 RepID=UPI0039E6EA97
MKKAILLFGFISSFAFGQTYTKTDTLKGSDTAYRNFWDVKKYKLSVEPNFQDKSLKGSNKIEFTITKDISNPTFQIDLQEPMKVEKLTANFPTVDGFKRDGDFIFVTAKKKFKKGEKYTFDIDYSGNPRIAKHAPWEGGWVFVEDEQGNPWITVAQEGDGTSLWLPSKDIWNDEPEDGIIMKIITPTDLTGVGNGKLIGDHILVGDTDNKREWTWEVKNPINLYSLAPVIGKFAHFSEIYNGEKGKLDCDYYVLDYNLGKAKVQFQQAKSMLKSFEYWFGPYPFYEDGYKLVETPHLGMEHQSNVAYGNHYLNGYLGRDLSGTGIGLEWDFIIIHESGHEWFANNITAKDQADMWIHESFTNYSETLYTESLLGKEKAQKYVIGTRRGIKNDIPIIGKYGVRNEGSGDMYPKGGNMIHTIRTVINNDEKFRQILRGLNKDFYHQTVTTKQIEDYISAKSGINFSKVFDQYLRTTQIPTLEYSQDGNTFKYRWTNTIDGFDLPIRINGTETISPSKDWKTTTLKDSSEVKFDENYYVKYQKI